ncbi:MAG: hypothetical protein ACRENA_15355 [Vulcanimicrobiaceae bacterium]
MNVARSIVTIDDAPPGFWQWPVTDSAQIEGVELESAVPTRFFQTLETYPSEWGRLFWRVQLNRFEDGRVSLPMFRTFYPGVEWNLNHPGGRWFLSAWFKWQGDSPDGADPSQRAAIRIEGDTVVFTLGQIVLRTRVDARDRKAVAESLHAHERKSEPPPQGVILLDDVVDRRG